MICFHFTIFVVLETTNSVGFTDKERCDLLSFYYLCRTRNNLGSRWLFWTLVVICFHFTIFVVLETTVWGWQGLGVRCDLLSFYYLCRTRNNRIQNYTSMNYVVICFHFTIFVVLETTPMKSAPWPVRCDLLSFYYLCRTRNNLAIQKWMERYVVICFHFTIFVVLETTEWAYW